MRLTLRTLLAYMDDILEPNQAREIGAKVAESDVATGLVNRIRDVVRRRRLTAPDLEGPGAGLDPNTVAEYLDNTLSPQEVADVERVCLESDLHLAEVAASHQILTLVLGEPVDVPPKSRERLYALVPKTPVSAVPAAAAGDEVDAVAAPQFAGTARAPRGRSFSANVPGYLRPKPLWRRAVPIAVLAIIGLLWLGLFAVDPTLFPEMFRGEPEAAATKSGEQAVAAAAVAETLPEKAAKKGKKKRAGTDSEAQVAAANTQPETVELPRIDPPAPPDLPDNGQPVVSDSPPVDLPLPAEIIAPEPQQQTTPEPAETEVAVAPSTPVEPAPAETEQVAPAVAAPGKMPAVQYVSNEGILLHHDPAQAEWNVIPYRSVMHAGDLLASPEPFDALFDIAGPLSRVVLAGGTAARLLEPNEAGPLGLDLRTGRIVLQSRSTPAGDEDETTRIGIAVGEELWRVELQPATVCGIEIAPKLPEQFEQEFDRNWYRGGLFVASGGVRIDDGAGWSQAVTGPAYLSLTPEDRAAAGQVDPARPQTVASMPQPLAVVPQWLNPNGAAKTLITQRYAKMLEDQIDKSQPLRLSIMTVVRDAMPQVSELAVKCLSLIGHPELLVEALAKARYEETRLAAIAGLRSLLAVSPESAEAVETELEEIFPADDVTVIYRLLWGFNEEDARNEFTSKELVGWLEHPNIVVRELAFHHIYRLTGRRYDYRPNGPEAQRRAAVNRWLAHLDRTGTLLPPAGE